MANYCGPGCYFCGTEIDPYGPRSITTGMVDDKWSIWHDDCATTTKLGERSTITTESCVTLWTALKERHPWGKG